jgi:hypothetical protein
MAQSTKPARTLLPVLRDLLAAHRPAFRQERPFQRLCVLVLGLIGAVSRHTLTQALVTLGLGDLDWSAAYRLFSVPRVDYDQLTRCFLQQTLPHVPAGQPYLVGLDGVQVPRHSHRMPGTSWLHDPHSPPFCRGIHRAQRFLHLAWLTPPTPAGYSRALPLRFTPAFPAKAVRPTDLPARTEWEAGLAALHWLRTEVDAAGHADQAILALGDGHFSNQYVWRGLPAGVRLLARCAENRALFRLPVATTRPGRPRTYGERAPTPRAWLQRRRGWTTARLAVRGRRIPCTYRVEGPYLVKYAPAQPLFLIVVKGLDRVRRGQRRQRKPSYWLVSAVPRDGQWVLPWPADQLVAWAWQRWELEVTHRDLKSGFGIGESQAWSPTAAILSVQWRVWVWSLVVLAGYRAWGMTRGPLRPLGRWWPGSGRWSFGQLWQGYRQELWSLAEFRPNVAGTPATWSEILDDPPPWSAALLGVRRT